MSLQKTVKTWDDYSQTEEYKALPQSDREILSRKYLAQKVAKDPEYRKLGQAAKQALIAAAAADRATARAYAITTNALAGSIARRTVLGAEAEATRQQL